MNCFSIWFKIIQYLIYFYWHYIIILYNFSLCDSMKICTGSSRLNETNFGLMSFPRSYDVLMNL